MFPCKMYDRIQETEKHVIADPRAIRDPRYAQERVARGLLKMKTVC